MARRNFLENMKTDGILPAAIGVVGVVFYAMQVHAPTPSPNSPSYKKQMAEWTRHVQTGQLMAVAALATGVLISRLKRK